MGVPARCCPFGAAFATGFATGFGATGFGATGFGATGFATGFGATGFGATGFGAAFCDSFTPACAFCLLTEASATFAEAATFRIVAFS